MTSSAPDHRIPQRIVVIDPNVSGDSPSLKSFLGSLPDLRNQGCRIDFWTTDFDAEHEGSVALRLPLLRLPSVLRHWQFTVEATLAHCLWRLTRPRSARENTLFISFGAYSLLAPVAFIHFSQLDWLRQLIKLPIRTWKDVYELVIRTVCVVLEWLHQHSPFVRRFIVVSQGLAEEFRRAGVPGTRIAVLPNSFDATRFTPSVRAALRNEARAELGLNEAEIAFCFCSMGHFRRKGLDLAFRALALVRQKYSHPVKLVLIGGNDRSIEEARLLAGECCGPDSSWLLFVGHQAHPEYFMSGCDAFILPSRSEAFGLVSLEASSLGLRLYLTDHHGAGMILEDGRNGRLLSWDVDEMARTIADEIESGEIRHWRAPEIPILSQDRFNEKLSALLAQEIHPFPLPRPL